MLKVIPMNARTSGNDTRDGRVVPRNTLPGTNSSD
jgi:hypothetical protein